MLRSQISLNANQTQGKWTAETFEEKLRALERHELELRQLVLSPRHRLTISGIDSESIQFNLPPQSALVEFRQF